LRVRHEARVADLAVVVERPVAQMLDQQPGCHCFEHRHFDELTFAGALAMHQGREDGERKGNAADPVATMLGG